MKRDFIDSPVATIAMSAFVLLSCNVSTELWIEASGRGHAKIRFEGFSKDKTQAHIESVIADIDREIAKTPNNDTASIVSHTFTRDLLKMINDEIIDDQRSNSNQKLSRKDAIDSCTRFFTADHPPFVNVQVIDAAIISEEAAICEFEWDSLIQEQLPGRMNRVDFSTFLNAKDGAPKFGFHTLTVHVAGAIDKIYSTGIVDGHTVTYGPAELNRLLVYRELSPSERIIDGLRDPAWSGVAAIMTILAVVIAIQQLRKRHQ